MDADTDPTVKAARNPPPAMVRPAHGAGLLRAPWRKGQSGNPGGLSGIGEWHRVMSLARQNSTKAMAKLIELIDSEDPRISMLAAQSVLERAWGRPKEVNPNDTQPRTTIDLSRLTPAEREVLMRIAKSGAIRPADDADVDTGSDGAPSPLVIDG
jgi:hypothetical protein